MLVEFLKNIGKNDIQLAGGKAASLGELMSIGLPVPEGFVITTKGYEYFIEKNGIRESIKLLLENDLGDLKALAETGEKIRSLVLSADFPDGMKSEILRAYGQLGSGFVAVRSSSAAEDLAEASFAGQLDSFMNVSGKELLGNIKKCFASLFTDRAISYRKDKGFGHDAAMAVIVQKQLSSESSGVMFTAEPESGHGNFIIINASFGMGDYVVQGKIIPDEIWIFKKSRKVMGKKLGSKPVMEVMGEEGVVESAVPESMQKEFSVSDSEAEELAGYAAIIENHYKIPMDIEWAKDGRLHILQARPVTVNASRLRRKEYRLLERGALIAEGMPIGKKISSGIVNVIESAERMHEFGKGQVLVTKHTDPDWEPIMKIASGIITETGGRTSHSAIVARELGVPAILGVKDATRILKSGDMVTIDCTGEAGNVWKGSLKFSEVETDVESVPKTKTKIYVNVGMPDEAVSASMLPVDGVGLAREEFIINTFLGVHPLEMIKLGRESEFVEKLAFGIAKIAAAFYPREVVVRLSDFKSNEYSNLKGGKDYEPYEENPMLGWRGAARYIHENFRAAFMLELKSIKKVVHEMELDNIIVMVPFCRTVEEGEAVKELIRNEGIETPVYMMAEVPSNIILADKFSQIFDGFSIGSNDLTQLTLGIDRDSEILAGSFDERNPAVKRMISRLIRIAHRHGRKVSICGEAPSNYPEFAEFLVRAGIDSISVNPAVAIQARTIVAKTEKKKTLVNPIRGIISSIRLRYAEAF